MVDYEAWRCCRDASLFCPDEGCPVFYGCARDKGWVPGAPSPAECRRLPALENMISHKNYNYREVSLARLVAALALDEVLSEGQISKLIEMDRVAVRRLIDDGCDMLRKRPPNGMSFHRLRERLG